VSIGSKFNLVALGIPVAGLLVLLGLIYLYAPSLTQAFLVLVAGFIALDGVVWNRLRSHLNTKMIEVWEHYIKPIRDGTIGPTIGAAYFFPEKSVGLEEKVEWVAKYGRYGPIKLYPSKLVKLRLVSKLLKAGEIFNSKLNMLLESIKAEGYEVHLYYAFDRWNLRKIPPEQVKGLDQKFSASQKVILDALDKIKKQEIDAIAQAWQEPFTLAKEIVSTLNAFSFENSIMPPKPTNPFEHPLS